MTETSARSVLDRIPVLDDQVMHRLAPPRLVVPLVHTRHRAPRPPTDSRADMPAVTLGPIPAHADVATEVADGIVTELIDEEVGERPPWRCRESSAAPGASATDARGPIEDQHLWQAGTCIGSVDPG